MSVAVIIISVSTVATTLSQRWTNADYLPEEDSALRKAAEALLEHDRCRVCFTSRDGPFDWRALEPNPAREIRLATVRVDRRSVFFEAHVEPSARPTGFGRLMIEFGDGAAFPWTGIVGARQVVHLYEKPGVYQVAAWLQLPNGSVSVNRQTVTISGSGGGT